MVRYIASREITRENGDIEYLLLLEYCDGGSLFEIIGGQHAMSMREILICFAGICSAVHHMHSQHPPITHRDLKLENVLLHRSGAFKLCDLGSGTTETVTFRNRAELARVEEIVERFTTSAYRAPEMCDLHGFQGHMDTKVDIWVCRIATTAFRLPINSVSHHCLLFLPVVE